MNKIKVIGALEAFFKLNNKKTIKVVKINSPLAQRFEGLCRILNDLNNIDEMLKKLIEKTANPDENFFYGLEGIVILYRKCFDRSGSARKVFLLKEDLRGATNELVVLHKDLIDLGNKHIAHAERKEYDDASVYIILNESGFATDIRIEQHIFEFLYPTDFPKIQNLIIFLQNRVAEKMEKTKNALIKEYNDNFFSE